MDKGKEVCSNMEAAVQLALKEAKLAAEENSYGVGGILIHAKTGEIIHKMHNRVIKNGSLSDPTAHGERQLVDWFYEQKYMGKELPEAEDVIIVTTLDPCYMCTGSVLASGFKAVVAAYDDNAGINWEKNNEFRPLEGAMKQQITEAFCYPQAVGSTDYAREAYGKIPGLFKAAEDQRLSADTLQECFETFKAGMKQAREIVEKENKVESRNPKDLQPGDEILNELQSIYKDALTYKAAKPGRPDIGLAPYLEQACREDMKNGGRGDAVAFLDNYGNLILCKPGNLKISPIRTAFMETIRAYTELRHKLGERGRQYLCAPKLGSFIFYRGFDKSAADLADIGAYGSSILGDFNNCDNIQYIVPGIPQSELEEYLKGMAARYAKLIKPKPVEDKELAGWRFNSGRK